MTASGAEPHPTRWRRLTATRSRRLWLIAGSLVVVAAIVSAVFWSAAPRPDATLHATGIDVDDEMLRMISSWTEVDDSTLLLAMERSTYTMAGVSCAPREADLFVDLLVWLPGDQLGYMEGLALGTVIRFHMHGDSVDAYLLTPQSAAAHRQAKA